MSKYLDYLDFAKGIGIILVIMGHSLFPLHIAIDIFHMPLFFLISGLTFNFNEKETTSSFILKKVNRILIPLLFFSLVSGVLQLLLPVTFTGPFNGPLWFLQVVFIAIVLYYSIVLFVSNKDVIHMIIFFISVLSFLFAYYNVKLFFELDLVLMATVFLHLGYVIKEYYNRIDKTFLLIFFIAFTCIYIFGLRDAILRGVNGAFLFRVYRYSYFGFFITSISGVFSVLAISKILNKLPLINYLGKNSLIILCVHFPFIQYINVFVSHLDLYNSGLQGKLILGFAVYTVTILFSVFCIKICENYLPKLTGYKSLFG